MRTNLGLGTVATHPSTDFLPSTDDLSAIASANATAANWSNNSKKITSLANGTAASDAAAFGQIPTSLPPDGRANSNTSLGTADSGQTWTALSGVMGTSSNQAYNVSGVGIAIVEAGSADCVVDLDIATQSGSNCGPIFRANSTGTQWYQVHFNQVINQAFTVMATLSSTITSGTHVTVVCQGTTVTVKFNGIVVGSFTEFQLQHKHVLRVAV